VGNERFDNAVFEGLHLVKLYAKEHVLLCLIPAFFIAGGIGIFPTVNCTITAVVCTAVKLVAVNGGRSSEEIGTRNKTLLKNNKRNGMDFQKNGKDQFHAGSGIQPYRFEACCLATASI
jgi:hypothetical protein